MANETTYTPKQFETVPEGEYLFVVKNVEVVENTLAKDGQDDRQIRLTLGLEKEPGVPVQDEDGAAHTQWGYMARVLGHKKDGAPYKSHAWSEAILGQRLNAREPFDFADLLDKRGKVYISRVLKEDGTLTNKIMSISPLSGEIKGPAYNENKSQTVAEERDLLMAHSHAKMQLIERGITNDVINACVARVTGSQDHVASQSRDKQAQAVKHLQEWAASPDLFNEKGEELPF